MTSLMFTRTEIEADYQAARARRDIAFTGLTPRSQPFDGEGDWQLTVGEHVGDD